MKTPLLFLSASALAALAGCMTPLATEIDRTVDRHATRAGELAQQAAQGTAKVASESRPSIEKIEGIWLPFKRLSEVTEQASAKNMATRRISVNRDFRNIQEVAERVTLMTGIPVKVAPDALLPFAGVPLTPPTAPAQAGAPTPQPGAPVPPLPPITGGLAGSSSGPYAVQPAPAAPTGSVALSYDGMLTGFLDVAAARFGVSWEWSDDAINVFRYTTRSFRLVALPGDTNMQNTIASESGGGGSGGGGGGGGGSSGSGGTGGQVSGSSTSNVRINNLSVWTAVADAVKSMLTARGTASVNAATGTVMVTDTPQVLARVALFINEQNASLSKQVMVNVRVLAVDLDDKDQYGINWVALNNRLGVTSPFPIDQAAAQLSMRLVNNRGSESGLSAVISALSKQGRVSQLTSTSLMTLNNQPAPLQVGQQTAYLSSSATTLSAGIGATTTLTPGLVTTGFSMSLVPHMLDKGRLMLQFAINISALLNLETVESGNAKIQTPNVATRNFLQRVMLNSGDTLILTGFEHQKTNNASQGVGSARNFLFGGGIGSDSSRSTLVILIQPIVSESI
ncbi:MAG: type pilus formation outer membrane protein PilN family [Paucimonas sp.]|nr:type pilus formation outer membrane protein PilN family [Paucimonas sp.]